MKTVKRGILLSVVFLFVLAAVSAFGGVGGKGEDTTSVLSSTINNILNTKAGVSYDTAWGQGSTTDCNAGCRRIRVKNLLGLQGGTDEALAMLEAYFLANGKLPANAELLVAAIVGGSLSYGNGTIGGGIESWVNAVVSGREYSYSETVSSKSIVVGTAASGSKGQSYTSQIQTGAGFGVSSHTTTLSLAVNSQANGTAYVVNGYKYVSPLVLDMNGDGKLEASGGKWEPHASELDNEHLVRFDIFGNGMEEIIEWVGPNDGLLVEPNSNGTVDGNSLFGSAGGFANGYEKLSMRDRNGDMKISGAELKGLFVWQDRNGDAKVDNGELKSVPELGISEIQLVSKGFVSSFTRNGKQYSMWDWWPNVVSTKKIRIEEFRGILENK